MEKERICILHISCMQVLVFQRKPCLRFMNKLDSFEQVQHFDAYN